MKLQKTLLRFFRKSAKLDNARVRLKELKKSFVKFNPDEEPDILTIQLKIDVQKQIETVSDDIEKLGSELMNLQRKSITTLKAVGIRTGKKILIENEGHGQLTFWYEGSYLYFAAPD